MLMLSRTIQSFSTFTLKSSFRAYSKNSYLCMKSVLVPIATGSEEIETVCIIDTLVRSDATVTVASIETELLVTCSRGVNIKAEKFIKECSDSEFDMIVIPGGMPGAQRLSDCKILSDLLIKQNMEKKFIGSICAAPAVVLTELNLISESDKATCYPAPQFKEKIPYYSEDNVVVNNNIITSRGPGTALVFSLMLVEVLFGKERADQLANEMLVDRS